MPRAYIQNPGAETSAVLLLIQVCLIQVCLRGAMWWHPAKVSDGRPAPEHGFMQRNGSTAESGLWVKSWTVPGRQLIFVDHPSRGFPGYGIRSEHEHCSVRAPIVDSESMEEETCAGSLEYQNRSFIVISSTCRRTSDHPLVLYI